MKKLIIDKGIYSDETVRAAVDAYKEYAKIKSIETRRGEFLLFSNCKYDEDLTVKEFENYLIGLENG